MKGLRYPLDYSICRKRILIDLHRELFWQGMRIIPVTTSPIQKCLESRAHGAPAKPFPGDTKLFQQGCGLMPPEIRPFVGRWPTIPTMSLHDGSLEIGFHGKSSVVPCEGKLLSLEQDTGTALMALPERNPVIDRIRRAIPVQEHPHSET